MKSKPRSYTADGREVTREEVAQVDELMEEIQEVLVGKDMGVCMSALLNLFRAGALSLKADDPTSWEVNRELLRRSLEAILVEDFHDRESLGPSLRSH